MDDCKHIFIFFAQVLDGSQVQTNFSLEILNKKQSSGSLFKTCLAACKDQLNLVTETSSTFPNSQTFHRREEFCLVVHKLVKTCSSVKAAALTDTYPTMCEYLSLIPKGKRQNFTDICPKGVWNPEVRTKGHKYSVGITYLAITFL